MRSILLATASGCLLLVAGATLRADDQADVKKVIDKAVKAMGGEAKLAKLKVVAWKGKGVGINPDNGNEFEITHEGSGEGMDRGRLDMEADMGGRKIKLAIVINKDKGWALTGDRVEEEREKDEVFNLLRNEFYAIRLAQSQATLLKDKAFKLSLLGDKKIGERDTVGVKAVHEGKPDVNLYFDKETGLVAGIDLRVSEPGTGEVPHEFIFSDYKDQAGVKHFTKIVMNRDGKKLLESTLTEIKALDKLDEKIFEKP